MRFAPGLAPLRHRDFALYFTGLTVSQCGSWMEQTLTTWLLYDITGSPVLLGIGGALRAVPIFTFGLLAGAIADRVDRRRLLLITQSGPALTSLGLGLVVATDRCRSGTSTSRASSTRRSRRSTRRRGARCTRRWSPARRCRTRSR